METCGRALYNLIRMNWQEDPTLSVEGWQVEDYRILETKELFLRLLELGLNLDEEHFCSLGEEVSSPEELTEMVCTFEESETFDQVYLLIFELWRRSFPEKQSLSIFCDQLDFLIDQYDQDLLENEEVVQEALADLERILDENVDQGEEAQKIFQEISLYCAHNLESFIYDFASEQIDAGNDLYASELLDAFEPYILEKKWFDFLHLRLLSNQDPDETSRLLAELLEGQKKDPDLEFLLDIARFLIHHGAIPYFMETLSLIRSLIQTEQDFQEILAISSQFYRLLDREEKAEKISDMLQKRQERPLDQGIDPRDIEEFFHLVEDLDRSEA